MSAYSAVDSSPEAAPPQRRMPTRQMFYADLSQCLFDFVLQLLPTEEEMSYKEEVRRILQGLIRTLEPKSKLLSFGSTANGFSLRNSDMDLCCLIDSDERLSASDLVTMLGDLLERETKFHVKPLPHARIPIVKLSLDPSPGLPLGDRLRYWLRESASSRKHPTSHVLRHDRPNPRPHTGPLPQSMEQTEEDKLSVQGHAVLRCRIAGRLFRYFSRDFSYNTGVASIRAGLLKKSSKGWQNDLTSRFHDSRERNRLCIEDPFELDFNVGRCVSKDGIYTIRGEFMRASRILTNRPERAVIALAELCAERADEDLVAAPNYGVSRPPPQTPYSVGSGSGRAKPPAAPTLSASALAVADGPETIPAPPTSAHMAPRRAKWTSPPPPGAPEDAKEQFETSLGQGIELATSTAGTVRRRDHESSSSEVHSESASEGTSEVFTDTDTSVSDAGSDVVLAMDGVGHLGTLKMRRDHQYRISALRLRLCSRDRERVGAGTAPPPSSWLTDAGSSSRRSSSGPPPPRSIAWASGPSLNTIPVPITSFPPLPPSPDSPPRQSPTGLHQPQYSHFDNQHTVFYQTSPRPSPHSSPRPNAYPTTGAPPSPYHSNGNSPYGASSPSAHVPHYPAFLTTNMAAGVPRDVFSVNHPPLSITPREHTPVPNPTPSSSSRNFPSSAKPPSPSWTRVVTQHVHAQAHSRSSSTITNAPTPKPHSQSVFSQQQAARVHHVSSSSSNSTSPLQSETPIYAPAPTHTPSPPILPKFGHDPHANCHAEESDHAVPDVSSTASSPTPSLSTGYETSVSMSPSPSPPLLTDTISLTPKSPGPDTVSLESIERDAAVDSSNNRP
ncbi:hypothetical protein MKEN_01349200 [Mycena kentingensis (nom. inval.)]|nr:hypothetical protein MKEN_01349200 [Mycena kentingensis (nom. inval.)]